MFLKYGRSAVIYIILLLFPSVGLTIAEEPSLSSAANAMKAKEYAKSAEIAASLPDSPERNFLLGVAKLKSGKTDEAVQYLDAASKTYPLLADYALSYKAIALIKDKKPGEALSALEDIIKNHSSSPLFRRALLQKANILFDTGRYSEAEPVFQQFINKYSAGNDYMLARYKLAECKEKAGAYDEAVSIYYQIWQESPGSSYAEEAEKSLKRVGTKGVKIPVPTSQEMYQRGTSLYNLKKFSSALQIFKNINTTDKELQDSIALKIAQIELKTRHYKDAEASFKSLLNSRPEIAMEAEYGIAKSLEKLDDDENAFNAYINIAKKYPGSSVADDALMDAAYIRKFQRKHKESLELFKNIAENALRKSVRQQALWEAGWGSYITGEYKEAENYLIELSGVAEQREKALYWAARSAENAGDASVAKEFYSILVKEYPDGFYALNAENTDKTLPEPPVITEPLFKLLPMPSGYERVKALISLGLIDDANIEITAVKKSLPEYGKENLDMARLYLEAGEYNYAAALFRGAARKNGGNNKAVWGILYPLAFEELVKEHSEKAGVPISLSYAIMKAESNFLPTATSPVGARGLMQLMPATAARMLHKKGKLDPAKLYNPDFNITLGTQHLKDLMLAYNNNKIAVIASYNAGSGNVDKWLKRYSDLKPDEFIESIPFGETREYVKRVLATAELYKKLYKMD
ncbi:MAG: transglycosylase SLT domain-containing protein [Desulfuromonadales bacterium]|nr:transglycosylase SLT domain-containing protein [Desulfuromonadales bacterium]